MTIPNSDVSSAPTSMPACAWASEQPQPASTPSVLDSGMQRTQLAGSDQTPMQCAERAELLGLPFDTVTMEAAVARCLELCRAPRASHTVITANASHLCMIRRDPELALACRA